MNKNLISLATVVCAVAAWPTAGWTLEFCDAKTTCKTGTTCHAGLCIPDAILCKADSGCAAHEVCDFSCPHGGVTTVSVPAPDTPSSGSGSSGSGSSGSGSSGSGSSGSGSSGSTPAGTGSADAKTTDSSGPSCPKDVGVCMVKFAKVKIDDGCQKLCDVAAKCDGLGGSSSSPPSAGSGSSSTPGAEPKPTPLPKSGGGGDDSGGDDGDGGSDDDDSDTPPDPKGDSPTPSPTPVPGPDKKGDAEDGGAANNKTETEMCAVMCSVFKLDKVAVAELQAATTCALAAAAGGGECKSIEDKCEAEFAAAGKAIQADELLMLKLGGGFGASDHSDASSGTIGIGQPEGPQGGGKSDGSGNASGDAAKTTSDQGEAAADANAAGGGAAAAATSGGCTAGGSTAPAGGALMMLLTLALLGWRRRADRTLRRCPALCSRAS